MRVVPTYKTAFSDDKVPRVERVHKVVKARNATEKLKETTFISNEIDEVQLDVIEDMIKSGVPTKELSPQEIFEYMQQKSAIRRDVLLGKGDPSRVKRR